MQIQLTVHKLTLNSKLFNEDNKINLNISIGSHKFATSKQSPQNNIYPFLEKNIITTQLQQNQDQLLIDFEIVNSNNIIGHKKIFLKSINSGRKQVQIKIPNNEKYTANLFFTLIARVQGNANSRAIIFKKKNNSILSQATQMVNQQGKLQILKMGVLLYTFVNKLDPLVFAFKQISNIFLWKNKFNTIFFGVISTLIIFNLRLSIGLFGIVLLLGRKKIIKMFQKINIAASSQRLVAPKQNFIFIQDVMKFYHDTTEKLYEIIQNQDKTDLITIIQLTSLGGMFLAFSLVVINLDAIIAIFLWFLLLLTSSYGNPIIKSLQPKIKTSSNTILTFIDNLSIKMYNFIFKDKSVKNQQIIKQFYIYEYQRWWLGKQWVQSKESKWSDQDWSVSIFPINEPPYGWSWKQPWKISVNQNTDQNGYQYANDFDRNFKSQKALKTLRRRKWKRKCLPNDSQAFIK